MSVQTAKLELHDAMYNAMTSSGTIASQLASLGFLAVYNIRDVPPNTKPEYILIGNTIEVPDDTFGHNCFSLQTTIDLYTRSTGTYTTDSAIGFLNSLFHKPQPLLALATLTMTDMHRITSSGQQDSDGLTWHGTVQYAVEIE